MNSLLIEQSKKLKIPFDTCKQIRSKDYVNVCVGTSKLVL